MLKRAVRTMVSMCMVILMVAMLTPLVFADSWSSHAESGFAGGSGTPTDPYQIANAQQLALLSKKVNDLKRTAPLTDSFILTQDIHLSGNDWEPIGTLNSAKCYFNGQFDGNGKKIDDLTIGTSSNPSSISSYMGLFGEVGSNATLKNISLSVSIYCGRDDSSIGGLIGRNDGHVINCHVEGAVVGPKYSSDNAYIGGLIGNNSGKIENCDSSTAVTGGNNDFLSAGGFIGASYDATIVSCHAIGNVTAGKGADVGGFIGDCSRTKITDCFATGSVTGSHGDIGGFIGFINGSSNSYNQAVINRCYATGNTVDANENGSDSEMVGGFAAEAIYCTITNSFAAGDVSMNKDINHSISSASVGGFAASTDGHVYNCFSAGNVTGGKNADLAGFITEVYNSDNKGKFIVNCYAYGNVISNGNATSSEKVAGFAAYDMWDSILNSYWNQSAKQIYKGQPVVTKIGAPKQSAIAKTDSEMKSAAFLDLLNANRNGNKDWVVWELSGNGLPYLPLEKKPAPTPSQTSVPVSSSTPSPSHNSSVVSSSVSTSVQTSNPQTGNTSIAPTIAIEISALVFFAVFLVFIKIKKYKNV